MALTDDQKRRVRVIRGYLKKLGYSLDALENGQLSPIHFQNISELQAGYLYDGVTELNRNFLKEGS